MKIGFYIFYAFAWLVSLMPFWLLYVLSDLIYLIIYYIARYRLKVTKSNLKKAFPDQDDKWINSTSRKYYRRLADIILENIKVMHLGNEALKKRFRFTNLDIIEGMLKQNKSVIVSIGHCGNWEWMGNALGLTLTKYKGFAIVKPLSSHQFDSYMNSLRNHFIDDSIIYFKDTARTIVKRKNIPSFYVFASDQTPTKSEIGYWGEFLNQDTPFFTGMEKIARSLDLGVIFIDLYREKRGHYIGDIKLISEGAKSTGENKITIEYVSLLEDAIRERPHNWLWSHRRWKHTRNFENIESH